MMLLNIILLAGLFGAISQYLDKYLVNMGISRENYFYYMCLSMIPFSLIMVIVEYFTNQLRFNFNIVPIILLFLAMFFRYHKQHTIVGCLTYLNPYEDSAYMSLGIIIAFILDVILGIEIINFISTISITLTLVGVFVLSNSKLKLKNLRKDLIIRILTILGMNYTAHFVLKYWSNAIFLLFLNLFLTLIFTKKDTLKYNNKIIKWVFLQQTFGFAFIYLSNYLSSQSVTLSTYVRPTSIIIIVIISLFFKNKNRKPSLRQIIGIIFVILGIVLI